jgi:L-alanine-DL-glutamate epimerase-like enolase superfamily enzyme
MIPPVSEGLTPSPVVDASMRDTIRITELSAQAYRIPTDLPEADGTLAWDATTLVVVEVNAGGQTGMGYTYSDASIVHLIANTLSACVLQQNAWDTGLLWLRMQQKVRNLGRAGLAATAISAIDCALWDLKARLLDIPLVRLIGARREGVPIYGSGGFTTYNETQLREQLAGWVNDDGCRWVKIKIGSAPETDPDRVRIARSAIGRAGLFVDANGALSIKSALHYARRFEEHRVEWFEEPVSSDDRAGLAMLR